MPRSLCTGLSTYMRASAHECNFALPLLLLLPLPLVHERVKKRFSQLCTRVYARSHTRIVWQCCMRMSRALPYRFYATKTRFAHADGRLALFMKRNISRSRDSGSRDLEITGIEVSLTTPPDGSKKERGWDETGGA